MIIISNVDSVDRNSLIGFGCRGEMLAMLKTAVKRAAHVTCCVWLPKFWGRLGRGTQGHTNDSKVSIACKAQISDLDAMHRLCAIDLPKSRTDVEGRSGTVRGG